MTRFLVLGMVFALSGCNCGGPPPGGDDSGTQDAGTKNDAGTTMDGGVDAGVTIAGTIRVPGGGALSGAVVHIGAAQTTSGDDGHFSISNVHPPYDLVVGNTTAVTLYRGLTRTDPTLSAFGVTQPRSSVASGSVTDTGGRVIGIGLIVPGGDGVGIDGYVPLGGTYNGTLAWSGPTTVSASLVMFNTKLTGATFSRTPVGLVDGMVTTQDLVAATQVSVGNLSVSYTGDPAGADLTSTQYWVETTGRAVVTSKTVSGSPFALETAQGTGGLWGVGLTATLPDGTEVYEQQNGFAYDATAALTLQTPPTPMAPANSATGIDAAASFTWGAAGFDAIFVLQLQPTSTGPALTVVTRATTASLAGLDVSGVSLPSATGYKWKVTAFGPYSSIDAFGDTGYLPATGIVHRAGSLQRTFTTKL